MVEEVKIKVGLDFGIKLVFLVNSYYYFCIDYQGFIVNRIVVELKGKFNLNVDL